MYRKIGALHLRRGPAMTTVRTVLWKSFPRERLAARKYGYTVQSKYRYR
jgi:hypothetical protein